MVKLLPSVLLSLLAATAVKAGSHMLLIKEPSVLANIADMDFDCRGELNNIKFCLLPDNVKLEHVQAFDMDLLDSFPLPDDIQDMEVIAAYYNPEQHEAGEKNAAEWKTKLVRDLWERRDDMSGLVGRLLFENSNMILCGVRPEHLSTFSTALPISTSYIALQDLPMIKVANPMAIQSSFLLGQQDDKITEFLKAIDKKEQMEFWTYLTGEHSKSNIKSRFSSHPTILSTAQWIKNNFEAFGFTVKEHPFQKSWGPNIVAEKKGKVYPNEVVVIGAHYDSRGRLPSDPAPGANDDGSGTAMLLTLAHAIHTSKVSFDRTIQLVAFCGEEQGLVGSKAYAMDLRKRLSKGDRSANVTMMIQGDMLSYRKPGEALQIAFPVKHHTPSLTAQLSKVVQTYVPELKICSTNACCSDHMSFLQNGFQATAIFERCGPIADDRYHHREDKINRPGISPEQEYLHTKSMAAMLASGAGINA